MMDNQERLLHIVSEKAEIFYEQYDGYVGACRKGFEKRCICDELASYAYLETVRFELLGDPVYGGRAAKALSDMGRLSEEYDCFQKEKEERQTGKTFTIREAVLTSGRQNNAPMDCMFRPTYFMVSYLKLSEAGLLSWEEKQYCKKAVLCSIKPLAEYTDWGPQNRGMIKGLNLMLAAKCFPEEEQAEERRKLGQLLCGESLGKWSIEDAQVYLPIWMHEILIHNEVFGDLSYFRKSAVYFYFEYMTQLLAPNGVIPEFGDGRWLNSAEAYVACLERGGAVYQDGRMRYAAARILETASTAGDQYLLSMDNTCFLASAARWAGKEIEPEAYGLTSGEILEDLIGKKYRLANDDSENLRYLLFNYRDEGDYAYLPRHYIRNTIVVDNEKTHHGHCDENSIVLLLAGESVLLHDGGYREMDQISKEYLPGTYRSDFYHNKLVVRNGRIGENQNFIDFCAEEETYNKVRSEKIFFESFEYCDAARTRLYDARHRTDCDRTIVYIKEEGIYVVLDSVTAKEDGDYTFGPVFYGEEVTGEEGSYELTTAAIYCDQPYPCKFEYSREYALGVLFPDESLPQGRKTLRRSYTQETGLFQYFSGHVKAGECVNLYTVLCPHKQEEANGVKAELVPSGDNGTAIRITTEKGVHVLAGKLNLDAGVQKEIRRPAYDFMNTSVTYGDLKTDAAFTHLYTRQNQTSRDQTSYEVILFTRVEYEGNMVYQIPSASLIQADWTLDDGIAFWNKWYGEIPETSTRLSEGPKS